MSTWSRPYLTVTDHVGAPVPWSLPDPLPWPAGAATDPALRTPVDLGLPESGTIRVRWRTPAHPNPRRRTYPVTDLTAVALACDVHRAHTSRGVGWTADPQGWPYPAATTRGAAVTPDPSPHAPVPAPVLGGDLTAGMFAGDRTVASPANVVLQEVANGRIPLGATVAEVIAQIRREREESRWGDVHAPNIANVLDFVEQVLVYTAPIEDDDEEGADKFGVDTSGVAAWKWARLGVEGVELGGSLHVALLLAPDLERAVAARRYTDRRAERANHAALARWEGKWDRYNAALEAKRAGTRGGGRMPNRPPEEPPLLRNANRQVAARTEELFGTALGMILNHCERRGLLLGPNPWPQFARHGQRRAGYRRSAAIQPSQRNVPPLGAVVALAEALARTGRVDPRTGRPVGERYRAMVYLGLMGPRPTEIDGLRPSDHDRTARTLLIARSAATVNAKANDGDSFRVKSRLKGKDEGVTRVLELPTAVNDVLAAHIDAGYASDAHLFTSPKGGPPRWENIAPLWQQAVTAVFGHSQEPLLRDMPRKWLRKASVTWMLRAGLGVEQVSKLTGHDVVTLYRHYAGMVAGYQHRHQWEGWDEAWAWAVQERDVP